MQYLADRVEQKVPYDGTAFLVTLSGLYFRPS
jgi:hypothetical protein